MGMIQIDINCDMGESYGRYTIGNDEAIFPYITSCNIACGFHGGDPLHIEKTIKLAIDHNISIGAHPSYPDLAGFGRRKMDVAPHELKSIIKYQIAAVKGLAESQGSRLSYVKPHGALYNTAADDAQEAEVICQAIKEIDPSLSFMGLAGSLMETVAHSQNIRFIKEAFADRKYTSDGRLMSRALKNAVIDNADEAARQVINICTNHQATAGTGEVISIEADSVCIHGDNPMAVAILKAIHQQAQSNQVMIKSFSVQ